MSIVQLATPGLTFDEPTHLYRLDGDPVPSVTAILRDNRLSGDFSQVDPVVLDAARRRGQAVHAAAHYLDEGDLDETTIDPLVRPYLEAWESFKVERGIEFTALEQRFADPVRRFAGTVDRIGRARGVYGLVLIDVKTGDYAGAQFQTAAYSHLAWLHGINALHRWVVQLHPGRGLGYSVKPFTDRRDKTRFMAALELTHARAELGRSWQERAA